MEQLTHRSCSRCIYWSDYKLEHEEMIQSGCMAQITKQYVGNMWFAVPKMTRGGDYCGQWKKVKELKYD